MSLKYPFTVRPLTPEEGGGYLAEALDLNGCIADRSTPEDAIHHLEEAIEAWIKTAESLKMPGPTPSSETSYSGKWVVRTPKSLLGQKEGVSLNSLTVSMLAEAFGHKSPPLHGYSPKAANIS